MLIRLSPARRAAIRRVTLPFLAVLSAAIIILGKADQVALTSLRISLMDATAPALEILSRPAAVFDSVVDRAGGFIAVYQKNERLREENGRLLGWRQTALDLAAENAELRDLLRLAPEPRTSYVTARIIAGSGGAYARSVMVNAGRDNGVARGQAVVSGDGLVGRVAETGSRAARILLITDLNSHVPVIVDGTRQRAILSGDNSERPSLRYVDAGAMIKIGERIVTSGQGGVFPPGLPVGVVTEFDGEVARVEPYASLSRIDYLRIVDYGLGDALPDPQFRASRGSKRAEMPAFGQTVRR